MDSSLASWMKPQVFRRIWVAFAGSPTAAMPDAASVRTIARLSASFLGHPRVWTYTRGRPDGREGMLLDALHAGLGDEEGACRTTEAVRRPIYRDGEGIRDTGHDPVPLGAVESLLSAGR